MKQMSRWSCITTKRCWCRHVLSTSSVRIPHKWDLHRSSTLELMVITFTWQWSCAGQVWQSSSSFVGASSHWRRLWCLVTKWWSVLSSCTARRSFIATSSQTTCWWEWRARAIFYTSSTWVLQSASLIPTLVSTFRSETTRVWPVQQVMRPCMLTAVKSFLAVTILKPLVTCWSISFKDVFHGKTYNRFPRQKNTNLSRRRNKTRLWMSWRGCALQNSKNTWHIVETLSSLKSQITHTSRVCLHLSQIKKALIYMIRCLIGQLKLWRYRRFQGSMTSQSNRISTHSRAKVNLSISASTTEKWRNKRKKYKRKPSSLTSERIQNSSWDC